MFKCCKKKKVKIEPRKRADSYNEYLNICINDWKLKNKNIDISQIAPKPPTPISTMSKYIQNKAKKEIKKNEK